jgi:hypothetical protein
MIRLRKPSGPVETVCVSDEPNIDPVPDGTIYGSELVCFLNRGIIYRSLLRATFHPSQATVILPKLDEVKITTKPLGGSGPLSVLHGRRARTRRMASQICVGASEKRRRLATVGRGADRGGVGGSDRLEFLD